VLALLGGAALFALPGRAGAYPVNDRLDVYGYAQMWLTLREEMQDAGGLFQHPSGHEAATSTTGFRLNRARLGLNASFLKGLVGVGVQVKLEGDLGLLDLYARIRPWRWLEIWLGQFKIPSAAENLRDDRTLDFATRSNLSESLADYSLSRTTYASSLLYGNRSYQRDLGLAIKLEWRPGGRAIRLFYMLSNGLGANLFISGNSAKGFLITNELQFFHGLRAEVEPVPGWLVLGGHFSANRHDNVVFNSGRVVLDLNRMTGSGDLELHVRPAGIRVGGLGGYGVILEDDNGDGKDDFRFGGAVAYGLWCLTPLLARATRGRYHEAHRITLGFRYEWRFTRSDEAAEKIVYQHFTAGVTYEYQTYLKIMFNAVINLTRKPFQPDLDDNLYVLSMQASF
jgi:hypothetical protein